MVDATAATAGIGRIIQAQESERQHVSRYLHDGPAQTLTNLVLKAEICEHMIERDTAEARAELQSLRGSLTTTLQDMRRLIFDLRPMILDDIGVVPTLRRYLAEIGRSRGFTPTVRGPESEEAISAPARALIFRLVQDVVAGLASRATLEQVVVDLSASGAEIELTIDVRASGETPPSFDEVINQEQVAQRLFMLSASTEVAQVGDRGAQLVINATTPAA
jgi:two-component system sensor histidine kinase DegS